MTNLNSSHEDTVRTYVEREASKLGFLNAVMTIKGKLKFQGIGFGDGCAGEAIINSALINNLISEEDKDQISYSIDTVSILEDDKNNLASTSLERLVAERTQDVELAYVTRIIEEESIRLRASVITYEAPISQGGNDITHLITGEF